MKLINIISQNRRDFQGNYKCEFCNHKQVVSGYDDSNYHDNVTPNRKCTSCGKSTVSENGTIDKVQTKYPEHLQL